MKKLKTTVVFITTYFISLNMCISQAGFEKDTFSINNNQLIITFIGHGTLMLNYNKFIIHVDPWSRLADYKTLPKADLVLVTHQHADHFDQNAIKTISKTDTKLIQTGKCFEQYPYGTVMENGDSESIHSFLLEAVPAYNIEHKRPGGTPFHPKGEGNGYILHFAELIVYIAGDTENIPEMKNFGRIDIAFIPVNLPYTMDITMAAEAAKMLRPKVLYPYHFGKTRIKKLSELLKDKNIDIRYRKM